MKILTSDDHEMLERLITFCRAASVAADAKQAESARRVEHFLADTRKQIPPPAHLRSNCVKPPNHLAAKRRKKHKK